MAQLFNSEVAQNFVSDWLTFSLTFTQARLASKIDRMQDYISQNARAALNQEQYEKKYSSMSEEYETLKAKCDNLSEEISRNEAKAARLDHFIKALKKADAGLPAECF